MKFDSMGVLVFYISLSPLAHRLIVLGGSRWCRLLAPMSCWGQNYFSFWKGSRLKVIKPHTGWEDDPKITWLGCVGWQFHAASLSYTSPRHTVFRMSPCSKADRSDHRVPWGAVRFIVTGKGLCSSFHWCVWYRMEQLAYGTYLRFATITCVLTALKSACMK